jgi:hypothetical protein
MDTYTRNNRAIFLVLLIVLIMPGFGYTQTSPKIQWQKCYGGSGGDGANSIITTSDGGFAFVAITASNNGDVSGNHGGTYDIWVVKLNSSHVIEWQRCLGGSQADVANTLMQTQDGGYVVVGSSESNDGDVVGNHPPYYQYVWIVKIDSSGKNIEWQRFFGGGPGPQDLAYIYSLIQANDGGIVGAGSETTKGEGFPNHGGIDAYIVKFDSKGDLLWQSCLGGSGDDWARTIVQTSDGGYVFVGNTTTSAANDGDIVGHHVDTFSRDNSDLWIVKLNAQGSIVRQKCLGGSKFDDVQSMTGTTDGGFVIAGRSQSTDGDLAGIRDTGKCWIIKLDSLFNIEWQNRFGGSGADEAGESIIQTLDGGYAFSGGTSSTDGDVKGIHISKIVSPGNDSTTDTWVVKLSHEGRLEWQKCLGGVGSEYGSAIIQMPDSGYVVASGTNSNDGDVSGNHGGSDVWLVKLGGKINSVTAGPQRDIWGFEIYPNPSTETVRLNLYYTQTARSVEFYDVMGRAYDPPFETAGTTATVTVKNLPDGIYFARVTFSYNTYVGTYTAPLVVQH